MKFGAFDRESGESQSEDPGDLFAKSIEMETWAGLEESTEVINVLRIEKGLEIVRRRMQDERIEGWPKQL